jgi:hypothetical protein
MASSCRDERGAILALFRSVERAFLVDRIQSERQSKVARTTSAGSTPPSHRRVSARRWSAG